MKFVTFTQGGIQRCGILSSREDRVLDLREALGEGLCGRMVDLIAGLTDEKLRAVQALWRQEGKNAPSYPLAEVELNAPIPRPIHDILCVGVNYKAHQQEMKHSFGKESLKNQKAPTVYFSKRAVSVTGPGQPVHSRLDLDDQLDYEAELAVIIGRGGSRIPKEKAEDYIFGYSVFNDFSSRKLQKQHQQWYRGKSLDSYSAMGPCILHKSRVGTFPPELDISSRVNGEQRQSSNTRQMLADAAALVSELSDGMTLEPGDIIATGTPSGVGMGFDPPRFLHKGDVVACTIEGIGTLSNPIE